MASIDAKATTYTDVAMKIWSFAEVGYQETRSSALLQEQLEELPASPSPPASPRFRRRLSRLGGAASRSSASSASSMRCPACRRPRRPSESRSSRTAPGHGCGHHLFGTASTAAAIAVKEWMAANKRGGTMKFFGTPGGGGRLGQGLHAPRRPLRRRRCRGVVARRRSQRGERRELARQRHREGPLPRRLRARLERARIAVARRSMASKR